MIRTFCAVLGLLFFASEAVAVAVLAPVDQFYVAWGSDQEWLPPLAKAWTASFQLQGTSKGWTAGTAGRPGIRTDLTALQRQGGVRLDESALEAIAAAITTSVQDEFGLQGVHVVPMAPEGNVHASREVYFVVDMPLHEATPNPALSANLRRLGSPPPPPPAPKPPPNPDPEPEPELEPKPAEEPEVVLAPEPQPEQLPVVDTVPERYVYAVEPFEVAYAPPHPDLPQIETCLDLPFELATEDGAFTAAADGLEARQWTLRALNEHGPALYADTALLTIATVLADRLLETELQGVSVAPDPRQLVTIGPDAGKDLRGDNTMLRFLIRVGRVTEVRTIASGPRVPEEDRINHPLHAEVLEQSPVDSSADSFEDAGGLIHGTRLQDYLHFLSRHPNRSVEASVAAASQPGGVALDYIITETKPWTAWYRFGNDGTRSEGYLRQQFGYYNSQLTNNDDILSVLYATSNFNNTNAVSGSYELPVGMDGRLRARASASWSQYFADQFGVTEIPDAFSGVSWSGSGELRANVYQDGPLFVDVIGGLRYQFVNVKNNLLPGGLGYAEADFVMPYAMVQLEQLGPWSALQGTMGIEGSINSQDSLSGLGRIDASEQWARLNWSLTGSTFLEPLLHGDDWRNPASPETSTLAHEVVLNVVGQWSMGNRLVPQFQQVAGGPGSNRGYPVSIAAADSGVLLTGEYRFHWPRTLAPNPEPGELFGETFRTSRQYVFGRPDWDLVPLAFVDASWLFQTSATSYEFDQSLLSVGVGLEFVFKQNMRARIDWGFALSDVVGPLSGGGSTVIYGSGNNRLYGSFTIYF